MAEHRAEEEEYLTTAQAARYLSLSEAMVRRLADRAELSVDIVAGRGWRLFSKSSLEQYKAERARNPVRVGRPRKAETQGKESTPKK